MASSACGGVDGRARSLQLDHENGHNFLRIMKLCLALQLFPNSSRRRALLHSSKFALFKDEGVVLGKINSDMDRIRKAAAVDDCAQDILGLKWSILAETMGVTLQKEERQTKSRCFLGKDIVVLLVQRRARVRVGQNDYSVHLSSVSELSELENRPAVNRERERNKQRMLAQQILGGKSFGKT